MGFFSDLWDAVTDFAGDAVTAIAEFGDDLYDSVVDFFRGGRSSLGQTSSSGARKVSKAGSYDSENATIEETRAITKVLNEIKEEFKPKLKQYEDKYIESAKAISDKIVDMIESDINQKSNYDPSVNPFIQREALEKEFNNKKYIALDINVGDIESKFAQNEKNFRRTFANEILSHISIGDSKCDSILKLKNKNDRKDKIKKYFDELVDNALNRFCQSIDEIAESSLKSIQNNINRVIKNNEEKIKNIKKEIEENMKLSKSEIEEKRKEYDKREKIVNNLLETIKL